MRGGSVLRSMTRFNYHPPLQTNAGGRYRFITRWPQLMHQASQTRGRGTECSTMHAKNVPKPTVCHLAHDRLVPWRYQFHLIHAVAAVGSMPTRPTCSHGQLSQSGMNQTLVEGYQLFSNALTNQNVGYSALRRYEDIRAWMMEVNEARTRKDPLVQLIVIVNQPWCIFLSLCDKTRPWSILVEHTICRDLTPSAPALQVSPGSIQHSRRQQASHVYSVLRVIL